MNVDEVSEYLEEIDEPSSYEELAVISGIYGLCKREKQFQDMVDSYQKWARFKMSGGFRDGSRRVEKARENMYDSLNQYFGSDVDLEDTATVTTAVSVPSGLVDNLLQEGQRMITEEEFREILENQE